MAFVLIFAMSAQSGFFVMANPTTTTTSIALSTSTNNVSPGDTVTLTVVANQETVELDTDGIVIGSPTQSTITDPSGVNFAVNPSSAATVNGNTLTVASNISVASFTVTANFDGHSDTATISVDLPPPPEITGISISGSNASITAGTAQTRQFTPSLTTNPANATPLPSHDINWTVNGPTGVTISNSGLVSIAANAPAGNVVVRATVMPNNIQSNEITFAIVAAANPVEVIAFTGSTPNTLQQGQSHTFAAQARNNAGTAANPQPSITWSIQSARTSAGSNISSIGSVAHINNNGNLSILESAAVGTRIVIRAAVGSIYNEHEVAVTAGTGTTASVHITDGQTPVSIHRGTSRRLVAEARNASGSRVNPHPTIRWESEARAQGSGNYTPFVTTGNIVTGSTNWMSTDGYLNIPNNAPAGAHVYVRAAVGSGSSAINSNHVRFTISDGDTNNVVLNPTGGTFGGNRGSVNWQIVVPDRSSTRAQLTSTEISNATPTRSNHTFVAWYVGNTNTRFTLDTTVNANINAFARWAPASGQQTSVINFELGGGQWASGSTTGRRTQTVIRGSNLSSLGVQHFNALDLEVRRTGYTFDGWVEAGTTRTFNINTNVNNASITVEPNWTMTDARQITFRPTLGAWPDGSQDYITIDVPRGYSITSAGYTMPPNPTRAGYTFGEWAILGTDTPFTATTAVQVNTTLIPRWVSLSTGTPPPIVNQPPIIPPTLPPTVSHNFVDVAQDAWYRLHVDTVVSRGLFTGTGDSIFSPNLSMTRAMFTQVLANLEGISQFNSPGNLFGDVQPSAWYYTAVNWAATNGIVLGVGAGVFAPSNNVTREQMAVMLINYSNTLGISLPRNQVASFVDQSTISPWALDAVMLIAEAGIVTGRPDGSFDPQATATRAEVATVFARFLESANI